jgi:hypothetical protein
MCAAPSTIGALLRMIPNNLQNGLLVAFAFGVGRALTRRNWGGTVLAGLNHAINNVPLTLDPSMRYAPVGLWSVVLILALTAFGFYA